MLNTDQRVMHREATIKDRSRFTLPSLVGGDLIFNSVMQRGNDDYCALTIAKDCSDQSECMGDYSFSSKRLSWPIQSLPKRKRFKRTFRGIAGAIRAQCRWANKARQTWECELQGISNIDEHREQNPLTFNNKAFRPHIQACGEITPSMKAILRKFSMHRTDEEVVMVGELVKRLKVFDKYPQQIREELGRILYYDAFEGGRLITRQGQTGFSFYFIVSGGVDVERIEVDKSTGIRNVQRVDTLGVGDSFGELTLLHKNTIRAASMTSCGFTEFLRIDRGEFEDIVQVWREKIWIQRAKVLGELKPFSSFSRNALMAMNNHARLETYPPNSVILHALKRGIDRFYIIVSGKCNVIRELIVIKRELSKKHHIYILPSREFTLKVKAGEMPSTKRRDSIERHLVVVDTLKRGDVLSGDESFADLFYISVGKAEVIDVPIHQLAKQKKNFEELKAQLVRKAPSREEAFNSFTAVAAWDQYKQEVVKQVVAGKKQKRLRC